MERSEIFDKLKEIIASGCDKTSCNLSDATEDSDLRTDLGLNSIGMLYLVISMEETLKVSFDDVSFNDFKIVKDVIDFIVAKQRCS